MKIGLKPNVTLKAESCVNDPGWPAAHQGSISTDFKGCI